MIATSCSSTVRPDNSTLLLGTLVPDVKITDTDGSITEGWQMASVPESSTALL
ncbi:MAG: hypothetical protein NTW21_22255 [Verrucomicrobia bacterium]|nr:hypothetical protein [Verrucomicrobiota bacterium]